MNEKSKAFELIESVWDNEKTDSYLRVNIAMYEAVKLATNQFYILIISLSIVYI